MNRTVLLILLLWFLGGCGNDFDRTKPHLINAEPPYGSAVSTPKYYGNRPDLYHQSVVESARIAAEKEKEIALIQKQRDIALAKLQQDTDLQQADISKAIAFKQSDNEAATAAEAMAIKKSYLLLVAATIVIMTVLLFYFLQQRRRDRLKMHEEMLHKEMYIKDRELQAKMVERILETLEHGALSTEQQTKLVETLHQNTRILPIKKSGV